MNFYPAMVFISASPSAGHKRCKTRLLIRITLQLASNTLYCLPPRVTYLLLDFAALKARLPDISFMYHDPVPQVAQAASSDLD